MPSLTSEYLLLSAFIFVSLLIMAYLLNILAYRLKIFPYHRQNQLDQELLEVFEKRIEQIIEIKLKNKEEKSTEK